MADRYVELLGDATKIHPSPADYLADVDAGFYASCYVRSWAFEAQIQLFLRERVRLRVVLAPRGRVAPA